MMKTIHVYELLLPISMLFNHYNQLVLEVMLPMAVLILAGGFWRRSLGEAGIVAVRRYISTITIQLFAPALMFSATATTHIHTALFAVPILMIAGILLSVSVLYALLYWSPAGRNLSSPTRAALLLCGMFGNVIFMGYPVLHFLYGDAGSQYAVFSDMTASTPLLWSLGVFIAGNLGGRVREPGHPVMNWLKLPPIWAFFAGVIVNLSGLPFAPVVRAAQFIGQPTVPVMLLMLGVSVPWRRLRPSGAVSMVVLMKLCVLPLMVWGVARLLFGPLHDVQNAAVLESGVPTMLMALSLSDRYDLDVDVAALVIAWTTMGYMLTLPAWLALLS